MTGIRSHSKSSKHREGDCLVLLHMQFVYIRSWVWVAVFVVVVVVVVSLVRQSSGKAQTDLVTDHHHAH